VTLDKAQLLPMLRTMILIREFDERAIQLRVAGKIYGAVHPYVGQEAVAVGVCTPLAVTDRVTSTHRGHGHCIAKGADIRRMMAELFGRVDGYCKGKGGSMHIADFAVGMLGANGIVGGGLPIACGAALAAQHPRLDIAAHAAPYDMPGVVVDGNDVLAVHAATEEAVARARRGAGPSLLECQTYRWHFHAMRAARPPETRPAEEIARWKAGDPIARLEQHLLGLGLLSAGEVHAMRARVTADLDEAVAFADASPFPDPKDVLADMFAE
jgi:acetoin:2,6-dichlorophenolindophenol oxidoreductase subunit alpha